MQIYFMINKKFFIIMLSCASHVMHAGQLISGDSAQGMSFTFPIAAHIYNRADGLFYVGASQAPSAASAGYAISVSGSAVNKFVPVVNALNATINGSQALANPLRGAQVQVLGLLGNELVAVLQAEPSSIYLVQDYRTDPIMLLCATNVLDALGAPTTGVLALVTNVVAGDTDLKTGMAIFAAVQSAGIFGGAGGGIAVAQVVEQGSNTFALRFVGTSPLNTTTSAVTIAGNLAAMGNAATLSVDSLGLAQQIQNNGQLQNVVLRELFIGLQVTAGAGAGDGAHGLIGAYATAQAPTFFKLAPDSAITADSIIAAQGPGVQISVYQSAVTTTTTALKYLIVLGGVSNSAATIYAMPLVSATGVLANVNAIPQTDFSTFYPYVFRSRSFVQPASNPGDLYSSTSVQAQVGGGPLPAQATEMFVVGDAVFAAVGTGGNGQQPGIFYSTALFDAFGRIKGWTVWQRATAQSIWGMALDDRTGNFWSLTGTDASHIFTVNRTDWHIGITGIGGIINQFFTNTQGQAQAIFDMPATTPSFDQSSNQIGLAVATGYQQVALVQSGAVQSGLFGPVTDFTQVYKSQDGTLSNFSQGVRAISMQGGVLNQLGAIIAAAVVTDGNFGWFMIAGSAGVAVLARSDGSGWAFTPGLGDGFVGLSSDMSWKLVGNYSHVRKLISDPNSGFVYILTDQALERLAVNAQTFAQGASSIVLAQASNLLPGKNRFLSDALISQEFAMLATSSGLLRIANGLDIRTVTQQAVQWAPVVLNESAGPVTRLFGISPTGFDFEITQSFGGNLYVLEAYVGRHQARIYRFTLNNTGAVTDGTLMQLPDFLAQNENTFFINIGDYRNGLATDGALMLLARSRYTASTPFVEILSPLWRERVVNKSVELSQRVISGTAGHHIGQIVRSTSSGSWFVPHDLGLFVQE